MYENSFRFIALNKRVESVAQVQSPRIGFDVLFRAEEARHNVLDNLHDSGRMHDHEVDRVAGRSEAAGTVRDRRGVDRHSRVEPTLRHGNEAHTVEVLDFIGNVRFGVDDPTLDVALQTVLRLRADEQDTAFLGDFVVIHRRFSSRDESLNIGGADRDGAGGAVNAGRARVLCKSVIRFSVEFATLYPFRYALRNCCIFLCR